MFFNIILLFGIIWVGLRCMSFGIWTWKKNNKFAAVMVFVLGVSSVGLPLYSIFIKDKIDG